MPPGSHRAVYACSKELGMGCRCQNLRFLRTCLVLFVLALNMCTSEVVLVVILPPELIKVPCLCCYHAMQPLSLCNANALTCP